MNELAVVDVNGRRGVRVAAHCAVCGRAVGMSEVRIVGGDEAAHTCCLEPLTFRVEYGWTVGERETR